MIKVHLRRAANIVHRIVGGHHLVYHIGLIMGKAVLQARSQTKVSVGIGTHVRNVQDKKGHKGPQQATVSLVFTQFLLFRFASRLRNKVHPVGFNRSERFS